MDLAFLQSKIPLLSGWIDQTLSTQATNAKPLADWGFQRLPLYYSSALILQTKVVVTDRVPVPPLSAMGLPQFAQFEQTPFLGITYKNTYFIRREHSQNEGVHFHELVHIVQWGRLGVTPFLLAYAKGLIELRYDNSPLEVMAYKHQHRFEAGQPSYDVEYDVLQEIDVLTHST